MNNISCDVCGARLKPGILASITDYIIKLIFAWRKITTCAMCKLEVCDNCILDHKCIKV